MCISKVIFGDKMLVDLTADTVTPETLAEGVTAHDAAGNAIIGTMESGGDTVVITTANEDGTQNIYIIDDGSIKAGNDVSVKTTVSSVAQTLAIEGAVVNLT